ncbi:MAG: RraA family protein [Geminicoccaceae bacterium]
MTADLTARLERCYTGVLNDVMRGMGLRNFVLPPEIRPLFPERPLAGPVFTVSGHADEAADRHTTLLEWTGLLSKAKPGHVVVCQPHTHAVALMGELSAETLQHRGVRGYVVDGASRDVEFILKLGFPLCFRHYTPKDIVGFWLPDGFDVPIVIGDVRIHPGDWLLADRDGIVIVPKDRAAEIVAAAETAIGTENLIRKAILEGMDPQQAYLKYGKF